MATDTAATKTPRIGVFGGAFDPVHRAHIALVEAARDQFLLDKVIMVPSGNPPHRTLSVTSDEDRLAMLRIAAGNCSGVVVDDWELHQPKTTYTYDTLAHLCQSEDAEFFFLMGEDSLRQFTSWHNWAGILEFCHLIVAKRLVDDFLEDPAEGLAENSEELPESLKSRVLDSSASSECRAGNIYFMDWEEMPISATAIRSRLLNPERDSLDLLDPSVLQYIRENRLYQNG